MPESITRQIRERLGHCDFEWSPTVWLDTGIPDLNEALGDRDRGLAYGPITEISGWEGAGKTAVFMAISALAQYNGAFVNWMDFENSFSAKWAIQRGLAPCLTCNGATRLEIKATKKGGKEVRHGCTECGGGRPCKACEGKGILKGETCKGCEGSGEAAGLGMDLARFALIQPYVGQFHDNPKSPKSLSKPRLANAQELCTEAELVMEAVSKKFDRMITVVDSIPAMLTEGESADGLERANLRTEQELPKFLNKLLRRWVGASQVYNSMTLFINQLRQNPMARFGSPIYTPGGNAPRFYSHIRVRVARGSASGKILDSKGKIIGIQGIMSNKKNKLGGVEQSKVGYRIMFKGPVEFVPASKIPTGKVEV